ncbi:hypothetical protein N7534_001439 [Penicillium rubens]|nr:hypothetical protein N7534_001439 [Penicillium rubens]
MATAKDESAEVFMLGDEEDWEEVVSALPKISANAYPIGDAPPEEGSFGPNISFLERLLAAVTPDFAASFLWDLANMYIWVLFARRLDAMIEQWTDFLSNVGY